MSLIHRPTIVSIIDAFVETTFSFSFAVSFWLSQYSWRSI